ncbi:ileal sodium/bile acid cotransporter [Strongylocentrotus purpuratus]|uniref:Ileal sodium/bile acid cotransporter n=1 Tax=Strongylocentrotus purpuratus TaxID=7668 RepID=A0A7M7N8Z9_STRPU|nr:ileal sodium/bile acid cotransporter [Strongylocentrotus purpuratus]
MTTPGITFEVTSDLLPDLAWNETTSTEEGLSPRVNLIRLVRQVIILFSLLTIMIAMGCSITVDDLKKGIRRPLSALIGMLCQFVLLPLIGFCLALAFSLPAPYALSVLIVTCSPGGNVSSVFTYWTNGDVCLSICMTAVSTVVAIGMMPLNLLIYSRRWTDKKAVIPFINIIIGLVAIVIPVLIGMLIRWKKERWTKPISMAGTIIGIILLIVSVVLDYIAVPTLFIATWELWLSAALVPPIGFLVGYAIAFVSRRIPEHCRTIAFETGCQNVALALALVKLTFRDDHVMEGAMIKFPSMYAVFMIIYAVCFITAFRLYVRYKANRDYDFTAIRVDEKRNDGESRVDDGEENL